MSGNVFILPEFLTHVSLGTQFLVNVTRSEDPALFSWTPLTPDKKFATGLTELSRSSVSTLKHFLLFDLLRFHYDINSCLLQFLKILRSWCQTPTPLFSAFSPPGTPNKCMEQIPKSTFYDSSPFFHSFHLFVCCVF